MFAKTHPSPPPGFFTTEAAGLMWLREPARRGARRDRGLRRTATSPSLLVLEWIDGAGGAGGATASSGRALARLHAAGAPSFGREDRRTTGSRALPNDPCATWAEFYGTPPAAAGPARERRRRAPGRRSPDSSASPAGSTGSAARDEPPARLHGDLWAGNRIVDATGGLADRPGGARRPPRVRPRDDAALRRVRRRLLRRVRGGAPSPTAGRSGSRCTRSRHWSYTRSSSVAATWRRRPRRSRATPERRARDGRGAATSRTASGAAARARRRAPVGSGSGATRSPGR